MAISDLIGTSAKFSALLDDINMVAPVDSAVLIQGETGTGKEVIARAIHEASPRRRNRFVALNCAAIPGTLLESELFGYEKGAFTGAVNQTIGRFQSADRGTLFLGRDRRSSAGITTETSARPSGEAIRAAGRRSYASGRCADHCGDEPESGTDGSGTQVPGRSLLPAERLPDDAASASGAAGRIFRLLAEHFVRKFARQQGKAIDTIPEDVMAALEDHHWPGNVRELQNVIERGIIVTTGSMLSRQTVEPLMLGGCDGMHGGPLCRDRRAHEPARPWQTPNALTSRERFAKPTGSSAGRVEPRRNWGSRERL